VAERRSIELGKVAAFQQSMLEAVDIEAMGLDIAAGLRGQVAQGGARDVAALEQALGHASTADVARGLIEENILVGAEQAIARDFAAEPALAANLRESVARVRDALGLYAQAASGFGQVAEYRAKASGAGSADVLEARREQAQALVNASRPADGVALIDQALADAPALLPGDRIHIGLESVRSEAVAALGDRPRALQMQRELHARAAKSFGERDRLTMALAGKLAINLARSGDVAGGRALMEAQVPLSTEVLGAEHKDSVSAAITLASMRAMAGDMEAAVGMQRGLVATQTRRLGSEHPATLSARGNLVNMLMDSGQAREALPEGLAVVAARTRLYGADDPLTLRSMLNLSSLYARLHDFKSALALQRKVIDARVRVLGPRHPDSVFIMINHAGTLTQDGQPATALQQMRRVLPLAREVLEPAHPQLQAALMVMADASEQTGDLVNEIGAYREVLEMRQAKLGDDHPQTIEVAWKLSLALKDAGAGAEGARLHARYVAPLLGADPATLDAQHSRLAKAIRESM
jgi:non-specific serine/threonine protein kinase/serine/threonine-protein kinase